MSIGASKSDSSSESGSEFNQNVWGPQGNALQKLYGSMGGLFDWSNSGMREMAPGTTNYMNDIAQQSMPAFGEQLSGGVYSNMGLQDSLMQSLSNSENNPSQTSMMYNKIMGGEGNNYADAMRDQFTQDATRTGENMLKGLDSRAAGYGMKGSSPYGQAIGKGYERINDNLQSNLAKVGYDTFDKNLQNNMNIAQLADQGTAGRQNLMSDMLSRQNTAQQSGLNFGSQMQNLGMGGYAPYMMPWDAAGQYANTVGAPTVLGSGTSSAESDSGSMGASFGMG